MKVLLIHPPWLRFFGSCLCVPPIALNYIGAYLREIKPEVKVEIYNADHNLDLVPSMANDLFTTNHETYVDRIKNPDDPIWREVQQTIREFSPDVVGISAMTASYYSALRVAEICKGVSQKIRVVLGGRHPSAMPESTMKEKNVDLVVIGEGEKKFADLLENLDTPEKVAGVAFKGANGEIIFSSVPEKILPIDCLPFPVFDSELSNYEFEKPGKGNYFTWSLLSARGCPFQCVYCASDKKVRFRSVENTRQEIAFVKERYGITQFCFEDDSFSLKRERMEQMCQMLAKEKVRWHCNTRADLLDEPMVKLMKNSGCEQVYLGIETGSPRTLKRIKKNIDLNKIKKAISLLKRHGILVSGFFIIGFHWENFKDMWQTVRLTKTLPLDSFQLNLATPLPGTALFAELVREHKLDPENIDWTQFHQGSLKMNFTDYPQPSWEKMLLHFQKIAFHNLKLKLFWLNLRKAFRSPVKILSKIAHRVRKNPRLIAWFLERK